MISDSIAGEAVGGEKEKVIHGPLLYNFSTTMYETELEIKERKGKTLTPACRMPPTFSFCCAFLVFSTFLGCVARDSINVNSTLYETKGETLVSAGEKFELGFFTPNGSSSNHSYLGIWYYNLQPKTVVWVANRDNPLSDSAGIFAIADDGNLKVLNKSGSPYWSTDLKLPKNACRDVVAKLLDSGNLVLSCFNQSESLWQSFDNPVDTFLLGMKMNDHLSLNSWTSPSDPMQGNFSFKEDDKMKKAFVIRNGDIPYWRSGGSDEFDSKVDEVPDQIYNFLYNISNPGKRFHSFSQRGPISNRTYWRMVMSNTGEVQFWTWESMQWSKNWSAPRDKCSEINVCGNFGICNSNDEESCKCLPGFNPSFLMKWNQRVFSDGCSRSMSICGSSKEFSILNIMKIGKYDSYFSGNSTECRDACLNDCRCQAYSYTQRSFLRSNPTCWIWKNDLNNIQEGDLDSKGVHELFVRAANSSIDPRGGGYPKQIERSSGNNKKVSLIVVTIASVVVFSNSILCLWLWRRTMATGKARRGIGRKEAIAYHTEKHIKDLIEAEDLTEDDQKRIDVQFFNLHSILTFTDNFSEANKLGQGGFGSVYKGTLPEGQEVAIKRLSSVSVQGLEEFKNEVLLIAKLQHRNLVKLLGYCLKGDEKILVYEYMPNKSLDFLIFDSKLCELLNWEMRFNIILGIARGLLYLHQDSRLRIVHRDLKTSNILLDEEMNPKISDFGLARIVEGKMNEGSTNRVVGTFGYMSPEYAIDGLFSVKSDVFSFGVVMLEILSGKKNTAYFNLLAYSWQFWREDKALELLDETLRESCNIREFSKCVNVALLCVQEDPVDRPTMSNVVVYLSSEIDTYPTPKQPAFFTRANLPATSSTSSSKQETIIDLAASSGD